MVLSFVLMFYSNKGMLKGGDVVIVTDVYVLSRLFQGLEMEEEAGVWSDEDE